MDNKKGFVHVVTSELSKAEMHYETSVIVIRVEMMVKNQADITSSEQVLDYEYDASYTIQIKIM